MDRPRVSHLWTRPCCTLAGGEASPEGQSSVAARGVPQGRDVVPTGPLLWLFSPVKVSKTFGNEMKNVLNNGTKMVCFITQRPVHLGTEISCCIQKSSGLADFSQRTFKLTGELQKCFQENRRPYFTECSEDEKGLQKPAFFADFFFFNYMNQLNKFLQSSRKKRSDLQ